MTEIPKSNTLKEEVADLQKENEALNSQLEDLSREAEEKIHELDATKSEVQRLHDLNEDLQKSVERVKSETDPEANPEGIEYDTDLLAQCLGIVSTLTANRSMRDDGEAQRRSANYVRQAKIMYQELIK